jgi:hypothetical protein
VRRRPSPQSDVLILFGPVSTTSRSRGPGKLSEVFLRFAQPLLEVLPEAPAPSDIERVCRIAELVWNSVVLEKLGHRSTHLLDSRRAIQAGMDGIPALAMVALLDDLAQRKRAEQPEDLRLIGHLEAFFDQTGQIRLRASEVAPPPKA